MIYTLIMLKHEPRRFAGKRPSAIITTLGILRPDQETKEFFLDVWFPFSSIDEIRENTGLDLRVSAGASVVQEPPPRRTCCAEAR